MRCFSTHTRRLILTALALVLTGGVLSGAELKIVTGVAKQPLTAAAKRLTDALKLTGAPLSTEELKQLETAYANTDADKATAAIQKVLDARCLIGVNVNAESRGGKRFS